MATLTIRDFDDDLKAVLRVRTAIEAPARVEGARAAKFPE